MRSRHGAILRTTLGATLVLALLALEVVGCHGSSWSQLGSEKKAKKQSKQDKEGLRIEARSGREVVRLSPNDTVRIMQRVGFSDDQIVKLGPDLYRALLQFGSADVFYNGQKEMIFAVNGGRVEVMSRSRGTFIYDPQMGRFVLGPPESGR